MQSFQLFTFVHIQFPEGPFSNSLFYLILSYFPRFHNDARFYISFTFLNKSSFSSFLLSPWSPLQRICEAPSFSPVEKPTFSFQTAAAELYGWLYFHRHLCAYSLFCMSWFGPDPGKGVTLRIRLNNDWKNSDESGIRTVDLLSAERQWNHRSTTLPLIFRSLYLL